MTSTFLTLDVALQQALNYQQAGLSHLAKPLYQSVLQATPNHPEANYNLGLMAVQEGGASVGLSHLKTAVEANPDCERFRLGYIEALIDAGQKDLARKALAQGRQRGLKGDAIDVIASRLAASGGSGKNGSGKKSLSASRAALREARGPSDHEGNTLAQMLNQRLYSEAERLASDLTVRFPKHGFAWKVLGMVYLQQGLSSKALLPFTKAANLLPADADVHFNLGVVLGGLGRPNDAEASYRRALKISPDLPLGHLNLGVMLGEQGRHAEAMACYRRAIKIDPELALAHYNLGVTLQTLGESVGAVECYRRALEIKPDYAQALVNLGNLLGDMRQFEDAVSYYRQALEIKPDYAYAHNNLGNALRGLGKNDLAVLSYRRALEIKSDYAEAYINLSNALGALGQFDGAITGYRKALEIKPDSAEAYNNMGVAQQALGQFDDAVISYHRATEISPDYVEAYSNLGLSLGALGRLDDAVASYHRALEIKPDYAEVYSSLLFIHNYLSDLPAKALLDKARHFGDLVTQQAKPYTDWCNAPKSDRPLRVGFVSGDLCNHPVGHFLDGVLAALASNACGRLEIAAYHNSFREDALTERLKNCCHTWRTVMPLSDEVLAQLIREDGIDILIDLSGHTAHNRLSMFARKPAPVQVSWLGYFATTGVEAMDYFIADGWTVPEHEETHFVEKVWRLPETYLCFTPPDFDVQVSELPAFNNGFITFGCFNNLTKMNDAVVALWAKILHAVPESRLFLKTKQLGDAAVRQHVIARFSMHGIDSSRLILEGAAPRAELLAAYRRVDIGLDPFPYPGGTTSVEALWMGVPVLTLSGDRFLSRIGESILQNAGLPEWVATDVDDYVARAVLNSSNIQNLAALRGRLRQCVLASPIFDSLRFSKFFEAALHGMWSQWCVRRMDKPL